MFSLLFSTIKYFGMYNLFLRFLFMQIIIAFINHVAETRSSINRITGYIEMMFNSFSLFFFNANESLSWSGIRCLMPILLQLVLRGYYSRTIGSPLLPIPDIRNFSTISRIFSPRVSTTTTTERIPKLEISSLSFILKCQFFRQTKTLTT